VKQYIYITLGFGLVAIGFLGIVLPVLPTTPFIILAALCFAQSSERWHQWLLDTQLFGGMLRNWERHRCVSLGVKRIALVMMMLVGGLTLAFGVEGLWPRLITGGLMLAGCLTVLSLKTCLAGCSECGDRS